AESPEVDAFRAILGETCLELGDYPAAKTAFNSVRLGTKEMLNIAPRVSRWLEVNGNLDAAVTIMHRAMLTADSAVKTGVPRELSAWFHLRVGDLEMRRGRLETAEQILAEGRLIVPQDHRLLAAQARLAAMQRDWKRAIALGDSSIAAVLDPITVALVGDAYLALGDSAKAQEYFRTTEVTVAQQPQQFHRALGLFLLDHDRQIDKVAMQAQQDLETRRDIYGYDLLAWARYRQGRISEARALMTQALKTGARDATLLYHAGMIDLASGDKKSAASRLEAALKLNPRFDPIQSEVATATLAALPK
ncbi:MAG TPA: tetratricopeptide repeat protein, partial [Gemmatimonadaceae bacterium]|nr:tetratricopeptide repeat protein [Gemmatimonadaceae bacterium]